jgi:hypothetical protein
VLRTIEGPNALLRMIRQWPRENAHVSAVDYMNVGCGDGDGGVEDRYLTPT